jgi:hypothetical protein
MGKRKFIRSKSKARWGPYLYDLVKDPGEKKNLAKSHPDIVKSKWIRPETAGDAGTGMESNQAFFTYDTASDAAVFHIHGKHHVYDPQARKWTVLPDTAPAETKARGSRWCSGFYDEKLNAHFYFNAGDSSRKPGDKWGYRYRRTP